MPTSVKQKKVYERAIKNWPEGDRPREKLLKKGAGALSDSELLAILFRTGTWGVSAVDLARKVIKKFKTFQEMSNFEIGRRIVEREQQGKEKADYGDALIKSLSAKLIKEFGGGFSKRNLEYMRRFYLVYSHQPSITQTVSGQLRKTQMASARLTKKQKSQTASGQLKNPAFTLSWSHYVFLIKTKKSLIPVMSPGLCLR
ncbi:MAG: hypothetical protein KAS13_01940 [Candidatus Omnitrophica bacterium]|nr:hypothetical protein [Candidatus Omnitrophota bacterium]